MGLARKLAVDANVLAVSTVPTPKSTTGDAEPPMGLMVAVSRMPFDLDMFGFRRAEEEGLHLSLFYVTPERLMTAINDEAGCWFTSGKILYGETLLDPAGILLKLRKAVNTVPMERRREVFESCFEEARTFPMLALRRGITAKDVPEQILLRDNAALARSLFLLNAKPPRGETWLLEDIMELEKQPSGLRSITDILRGMDRLDLRRFEKARKVYGELISEIRSLAKNL